MSAKRIVYWAGTLAVILSHACVGFAQVQTTPPSVQGLVTEASPLPAAPEEQVGTIGEDGVPTDLAGNSVEPHSSPAAQSAPVTPAQELSEADDADPSALTDFKKPLDPYGRWVQHPEYGTIWIPHERAVGSKFAPYVSSGRWALNEYDEWVWVSDYPFGWVVFHYGRWIWAPNYGWSWIPGRRYAPAWVTFRTMPYGGAFVGWAPMQPLFIWRGGRAVWISNVGYSPYVFCPMQYAFYPSVRSYVVYRHHRVRELVSRSRRYATASSSRLGASPRVARYQSPAPEALGAGRRYVPQARVKDDPRALSLRKFSASSSRSPSAARQGTAVRPRNLSQLGSRTDVSRRAGAPATNARGRSFTTGSREFGARPNRSATAVTRSAAPAWGRSSVAGPAARRSATQGNQRLGTQRPGNQRLGNQQTGTSRTNARWGSASERVSQRSPSGASARPPTTAAQQRGARSKARAEAPSASKRRASSSSESGAPPPRSVKPPPRRTSTRDKARQRRSSSEAPARGRRTEPRRASPPPRRAPARVRAPSRAPAPARSRGSSGGRSRGRSR